MSLQMSLGNHRKPYDARFTCVFLGLCIILLNVTLWRLEKRIAALETAAHAEVRR